MNRCHTGLNHSNHTMTKEHKPSNRNLNRRSFLGLSAGLAATSVTVLPSTARTSARPDQSPSTDLPVKQGYRPLISSAWIPRGEHEQSRDLIRQVLEGATDFNWLKKGGRRSSRRVCSISSTAAGENRSFLRKRDTVNMLRPIPKVPITGKSR